MRKPKAEKARQRKRTPAETEDAIEFLGGELQQKPIKMDGQMILEKVLLSKKVDKIFYYTNFQVQEQERKEKGKKMKQQKHKDEKVEKKKSHTKDKKSGSEGKEDKKIPKEGKKGKKLKHNESDEEEHEKSGASVNAPRIVSKSNIVLGED